jgi:ABC-type uncharacterized transport system substrate-binding protein
MAETMKIPNIKRSVILMSASLIYSPAQADRCLYVSSYHQGYEWSDGVEKGIRDTLSGKCELKQFDMDTKRNKTEEDKKKAALEAKKIIEQWKPDVVITADDNAAKYLIKPYYKDHNLPFVFCGVNWNVDAYGFPYSNTTGMVEIAPINPLFERIEKTVGQTNKGFYIGAKTLTEEKNLSRFLNAAEKRGIQLDSGLATSTEQWMAFYSEAQKYDFLIVGSYSGINDWNKETIQKHILENTSTLSVTNHDWMMPYTIFGLTKVPEEQGQWAATTALHILQGHKPSEIAIVANRKWDIWINREILDSTEIKMSKRLLRKAKLIRLNRE